MSDFAVNTDGSLVPPETGFPTARPEDAPTLAPPLVDSSSVEESQINLSSLHPPASISFLPCSPSPPKSGKVEDEESESSFAAPLRLGTQRRQVILHVLCVQFHHRYGPQVEYAYPPLPSLTQPRRSPTIAGLTSVTSTTTSPEPTQVPGTELPDEWSFLPFLCLPDGAHLYDEEYIYFHLPPVSDPSWPDAYTSKSLFGLACYNQIDVNELVYKSPDMTRSSVQKAVVVLAADPVLGVVKNKLGLVTQAFFAQRDFSKIEILQTLYDNLSASIRGSISDSQMLMSISLPDLVHTFKLKTLALFKLLLLERRILFFGSKVEKIARHQYSLISLIPDLLRNLYGSGDPKLGFIGAPTPEAGEKVDRRHSSTPDLPLQLFGKGSFFQPYIPLQQVDVIKSPDTKSFIIGSTNSIFTHHKGWDFDCVVNCDTGVLEVLNPALNSLIALSAPDKKFIEEIVKPVLSRWKSEEDVNMNQKIGFEGSDDDIRARFEYYLDSMLVSVKVTNEGGNITRDEDGKERKRDITSDFGAAFIKAWQSTSNYAVWNGLATSGDLMANHPSPGHPFQGTTVFSALSNAMSAKLNEFSKSMAPLQNNLSRAVVHAEATLTRTIEDAVLGSGDHQQQGTSANGTATPPKTSTTPASGTLFTNMSNYFAQKKREWNALNYNTIVPMSERSSSSLSDYSLTGSVPSSPPRYNALTARLSSEVVEEQGDGEDIRVIDHLEHLPVPRKDHVPGTRSKRVSAQELDPFEMVRLEEALERKDVKENIPDAG